jgi:hypothetical protein
MTQTVIPKHQASGAQIHGKKAFHGGGMTPVQVNDIRALDMIGEKGQARATIDLHAE